jgi:hypothetical protein
MSLDSSAADRLSNYLDAVVTGESARAGDLEPELTAAVEDFFAADDAPGPPPGLADSVWQQLMGPAAVEQFGPNGSALSPTPNGRSATGPWLTVLPDRPAEPRRNGSRTLAYLATAALILLTLVGGFVAYRDAIPLIGPDQRAIILPAIDTAPERVLPAKSLGDAVLLRSRIDQMPPEAVQSHQIALNRVHLAPGAVEPAGSQENTGVGVNLFTVESGRVTVEADAPVFLTRAFASTSTARSRVEPGTAVALGVGDQLYAPTGVTFSRRNDGSAPATLLSFSIGTAGDMGTRTPLPTGVTYDSGLPDKQPPAFPAVPAEAIVQRLTLPPGDEVAVRDVPGLQLVYVETGALDVVDAGAVTPATAQQAVTIDAGRGTEISGSSPERAVLANRGTEPLVILAASVVSTSAGAPTPDASWPEGWGSGDYGTVSADQST